MYITVFMNKFTQLIVHTCSVIYLCVSQCIYIHLHRRSIYVHKCTQHTEPVDRYVLFVPGYECNTELEIIEIKGKFAVLQIHCNY